MGLATSLSTSSLKATGCILCSNMNHKIAKCTKYDDAKQKLDRLKELTLCFKSLKEGHLGRNCNFMTFGKCMKCSNHWNFLCTSD